MKKRATKRKQTKLAARITHIRDDRSQRGWAKELGVFQQNIHRYETGTPPHLNFLITLALAENVDLNWLLLGEGAVCRR
jgi:transcriptional regulator with XRE-family HTH domain